MKRNGVTSKIVGIALVSLVVGAMLGGFSVTVGNAAASDGAVVTFADPNLEAAIREAIEKPTGDIYQSDLEGLTALGAWGRSISDLAGLEYCVNLERLFLNYNQITDIQPLSNLIYLRYLYLDSNQISDLQPLSNLTYLRYLYLTSNQISDLQPLSNLTYLDRLEFGGNQITDIQPLSNLTYLRYLYLYGNQITDIQPLSNLTYLRYLYLYGNQITDIQPLSNLTYLDRLEFGGNQITDIQPLSNLTYLRYLNLDSNQISDLQPLSNLTYLNHLELGGNQITDIQPLSNLIYLDGLFLNDNQITDIQPLSNLIYLDQLGLAGNQISDLQPLSNLIYLDNLSLGGNQITDIQPLSNLIYLDGLFLNDNQITDIQPLSNLTYLRYLNLDSNQISDISPLVQNEGLGEGDEIDLRGNPLNEDSLKTYIPQLQERGVAVLYDGSKTWHVDASPTAVNLTAVGETQQLTVTATYSDGSTADVTAASTYVSSDTSVATVSTGGLITAVAEGSATITVSYTEDGITKETTVPVTVGAPPGPSATRTLPASVDPGADFDVTIAASGCGAYGQVVETLPDGFSYVSCASTEVSVTTTDNTIKFTFIGDSVTFTYTVKASTTQGVYTFSGVVKDENKVEYPIGGDENITVGFDPMDYDADGDGVISEAEALNAVVDYFDGVITKEQALEVIALYFAS